MARPDKAAGVAEIVESLNESTISATAAALSGRAMGLLPRFMNDQAWWARARRQCPETGTSEPGNEKRPGTGGTGRTRLTQDASVVTLGVTCAGRPLRGTFSRALRTCWLWARRQPAVSGFTQNLR